MYHIVFIYSSFYGHLSHFYFLSLMDKCCYEQLCTIFMWTYVLMFLGCMSIPGSEIAGWYGSSLFNHMRNCQIIFQSDHTILQYPQQGVSAPISSYPCQHLELSVFWIAGCLVVIKWYLIALLICISLMANVGHLCMCLFDICISSLDKCLLRSSDQFLIGLLYFLL